MTNTTIAIYSLLTGRCVQRVDTVAAAWQIVAANPGLYYYQ